MPESSPAVASHTSQNANRTRAPLSDAEIKEIVKKKLDDEQAVRLEVRAERLIKARLKDPRSFRWVGVGYTENTTLGFVIFGSFSARNSFGGVNLTRFIYGGGTLLLEGEAERFEEAWTLLLDN